MDIFIQNVGLSIVLQLSFYSAVRCYRPIRETPKRAAWVLTLLTAWLIAPCSFPYVRDYFWNWDEAANFTADPLSRFLVTFFLTFLVMDIVRCQLHYKNEMGFVEGWFHHSCYLGFFGWLLYEGWTVGILTTMPLEVPTVVLATGRVFPGLRQDLLFGISFLIFRIVYHSFLLYRWYHMVSPPTRLWPYPAFILLLHFYWFHGWVKGQLKRTKSA